MSRVLVIGSETLVSKEIGGALAAADFPIEYSAGHADTLQRLRKQSFGVVVTHPDSSVEEDLALLEEIRGIRPGVKCILLAHHPDSSVEEDLALLEPKLRLCPSTDVLIRSAGVQIQH